MSESPATRSIACARRLVLAALVATASSLLSCGGNGGSGGIVQPPRSLSARFTASGTAAAADGVRLELGSRSGDLVTVDVTIMGPTTSSDLYSFAFDLVLGDPSVATYVDGTAMFGSALVPSGGQGQTVFASQNADRVVVGVSKTGGGSGNGIPAAEEIVVSLTFQVLRSGVTSLAITGSPANPQNPTSAPAALDSSGTVVPSIQFDTLPATLSGV